MRIVRLASGGVRHVRTEAGEAFFHKPIGAPITEAEYQDLLRQRREAQKVHPKGHPRRLEAERAVRQARKQRGESGGDEPPESPIPPTSLQGDEALQHVDSVSGPNHISAASHAAIDYYNSMYGYRHINNRARGITKPQLVFGKDQQLESIKKLDQAFEEAAPLAHSIEVHRGLSDASHVTGNQHTDAGFMSTTTSLKKATDYANGMLGAPTGAKPGILHLTVPVGTKAISTEPFKTGGDSAFGKIPRDMKEVLLPRGSGVRIHREEVDASGMRHIYGTVESPKATNPEPPISETPAPAPPAPELPKPKTIGEQVGRTPGYQQLLDNRRDARAKYPVGHPERVKAEQAVRRARREREKSPPETASDYKAPTPEAKPIVSAPTGSEPLDFEDLNLNGKPAWRAITSNGRYLIEKRGQGDYSITALNSRVIDAGGDPEKAVRTAEGITRLSDAFDAVQEFERSGTFFGTGPEKTAWQNEPGYQELQNGFEVIPYGPSGRTRSFHPTAEANATRWFRTRREAEEFIQSKPQVYQYDSYWRREGRSGPTVPIQAESFGIKRRVNGQSTFSGMTTRKASDRVYFGDSGHPTDDIPIAFTDPKSTRGDAERVAADRVRSQMQHQYDYAPELVEEVHIAIQPTLQTNVENAVGINAVRGTSGSDLSSAIGLHHSIFVSLNSDPANPAEVLKRCQEKRHWVPTDPKWSLADVVSAHETGHGAAYRTFGTAAKGLPTDKAFWESFVGILQNEGIRRIGGLAYETNLRLPTVIFSSVIPDSDKAEALEAWASTNKLVLSTAVSKYGSTNLRELMAEMWCEYTLNSNPRPAAKFYGDYVTKFTRQRTRKAGVI